MDSNCFHVGIQERSHHERNGVLEKKMKKQRAALKKNRKECPSSFFTIKVISEQLFDL
jgi:hypothetical protein